MSRIYRDALRKEVAHKGYAHTVKARVDSIRKVLNKTNLSDVQKYMVNEKMIEILELTRIQEKEAAENGTERSDGKG